MVHMHQCQSWVFMARRQWQELGSWGSCSGGGRRAPSEGGRRRGWGGGKWFLPPLAQCVSPALSPVSSAAPRQPCASRPWTPPPPGWRRCPAGHQRLQRTQIIWVCSDIWVFSVLDNRLLADNLSHLPKVSTLIRKGQIYSFHPWWDTKAFETVNSFSWKEIVKCILFAR